MLAAQMLLARALPMNDYGTFIYATNLIALLTLLVQFGFPSATMKFMHHYAHAPSLLKGFVRISFLLPFMAGCVLVALAALLAYSQIIPLAAVLRQSLLWAVWVVLFFAAVQTAQQHLRAMHHVMYAQCFEQIGLPLLLIAFGAWALIGKHTIGFHDAIVYYGMNYMLVAAIVGIVLCRLLPRHADVAVPATYQTRFWLKTALPMGIGVMAIALLSRLDILLLGMYLDAQTVAHYGVASRIAALLMFALAALGVVLDPMISRLYHQGEIAAISHLISRVVRLVVLGGIAAFMVLYLLGDEVLRLFGEEYVDARTLMLILAAGQLMNLSAGPSVSILNISGHQHAYMKLLLCFIVLSVAALMLVIPVYGALGAAIVTTTLLIGMNMALGILIYRKTGIRII